MNDESLKKFNRIITILILLQSRKVVKAQDMATRFAVSLRTVYRDIQVLEQAGVPVIGEPGQGYSIMEGYRLPPVMFTREEAMSFVTAEKLMQQFSDKSIGHYFEAAMTKIKSVLRSTQKEMIEDVSSNIDVRQKKALFNTSAPNALELVLDSIVRKLQVRITYRAFSDEETLRHIEPVGIFYEHGYWYILGYCLLRQDYRQFRTDRMLGLEQTTVPFSKVHGNLSEYQHAQHTKGTPTEIVLMVAKGTARYIAQSKLHYGFSHQRELEQGIEMTFHSCDLQDAFPRWLLMFADHVRIIKPAALQVRLRELIDNIQTAQERDTCNEASL